MMSLHWGTPGAGKTYNMMKYELLPALASGRSVFTNINGLQNPSCLEAISNYTKKTPEEIKQLLNVFPQEGRIFFGMPDKQGNECSLSIGDDLHLLVRKGNEEIEGDLIVLDEASDPELFDVEKRKVNNEMWLFFKKHRHYNVDIILMAHHPRDLIPKIARLCAEYTYYRKLIGVSNNRYRYDKWLAGYSTSSNGTKVKSGIESYEKEIFDCYKSTVVGDGTKDGTMDNRFSFLKSSGLKMVILAVLILLIGIPFFISSYFGDDNIFIKQAEALHGSELEGSESHQNKDFKNNSITAPSQNNGYDLKSEKMSPLTFIEKLYLQSDVYFDAIITHKTKVTGWVTFWKDDKKTATLSFSELRTLGSKLSYPRFNSHFMRIQHGDKTYYALNNPNIVKADEVQSSKPFEEVF